MRVCVCVHALACAECPAGTEPVLGYEYKWWNVLPSNMKTSCFNVGNSKCDDMNGERSNTRVIQATYCGIIQIKYLRPNLWLLEFTVSAQIAYSENVVPT